MAAILLRGLALLLAGSVGLIMVSFGIGTLLNDPPQSVMAQNNCDLPCAFGVTPGVTDRQTAEDTYHRIAVKPASFLTALQFSFTLRVSDAPGLILADSDHSAGNDGLALALVQFQHPVGGDVRAVRLYEMSPTLQLWQLGELLLKAPQPDRVFASCDPAKPALLLVFGTDTIAEVSPTRRLSPDMEITRIAVTADLEVTLAPLLASYACSHETFWKGFAPYWTYQAS